MKKSEKAVKKSEKVINLSKEPELLYKEYSKNYSKKPLAFRTNTVFKEDNTPAVINKAELESKDNNEEKRKNIFERYLWK